MTYSAAANRKIKKAIEELQAAISTLEQTLSYNDRRLNTHETTVHNVNDIITAVLLLENL